MDRSTKAQGVYTFGPFELDVIRRNLRRAGEAVTLTPTVFDALAYLVENPGRIVTKDELLDALWPGRFVEEGNVRQTIFSLRRGLGPEGDRMIITAPGRGYRLAAPVSFHASPAPPDASLDFPTPSLGQVKAGPRRRTLALAGLAICALVVAALAVLIGIRMARGQAPASRNIVVSTIANRTGDAAFDHAPETLIRHDLNAAPNLNVASTSRIRAILTLMRVDPAQALSPPMAMEVCKRMNGGAVIDGAVDRIGANYLITAQATDCATDRVLRSEQAEFKRKDDAIGALEHVGLRLRNQLAGGSWAPLRDLVPLDQGVTTASFPALQAYSQALYLGRTGHEVEEEPLLRKAVELDPRFASAWVALEAFYVNSDQDKLAQAAISKAYDLRDTVGERENLKIRLDYAERVENDPIKAVRILKSWLAFHDSDLVAWCDLGAVLGDMLEFKAAIAPLQRCVGSGQVDEGDYANLMDALAAEGRLAEARAVAAQARRLGISSSPTQRRDADLAFLQGDTEALTRLADADRGTPSEPWVLYDAVSAALAQGKVEQARTLQQRTVAAATREGAVADDLAIYPEELIELGYEREGRGQIAALADSTDPGPYNLALARGGDPDRALKMLEQRIRASPHDPGVIHYDAPRIRAAVLARQGKLSEALDQFRAADLLTRFDFGLDYQHGVLALEAGRAAEAAAAFRDIIGQPARDPVSPRLPLAHLGLARALAAQHDFAGARREYETLFRLWSQADAALPPLVAARQEYLKLSVERP